ncbi:MAG: type VI secretion system tip protein TssI/VgrG [Pseudomonadota bacterium]
MTVSKPRDNASVWMSGNYEHAHLKFETAIITERVSTLTEMQVEFTARKTRLDLSKMVGRNMTVHVAYEGGGTNGRMFTGTCISVEAEDTSTDEDKYIAEVRPWFWMLTLTRNNRVFQERTAVQIIQDVLGKHNFGANVKISTSNQYAEREYCVQYRESDFDFLSRLMEEEGLFYYFDCDDAFLKDETLVITDSFTGFKDVKPDVKIPYHPRPDSALANFGAMHVWSENEAVVRGKVDLRDYQFLKPSVKQQVVAQDLRGGHAHKSYEYYDLPGHFRDQQDVGKKFAEVRLGAETSKFKEFEGFGSTRVMGSGFRFALTGYGVKSINTDYAVIAATHRIQDPPDFTEDFVDPQKTRLVHPDEEEYTYRIVGIEKTQKYSAPLVTPWPEVPGVQTGVVVGPSGEEIHTDKYGRVKVHFRWDRVNPEDDTASCWIRVASGWSGKNWGLNWVPRIGQEVLIQFEDGDPDRPIVTGMLYNEDTMHPYIEEDQPTQTGLQTRSVPNGGSNDFNALLFEDKSNDEFVHIQSQKDYQMLVKDAAQINIGTSDDNVHKIGMTADPKSLLQIVEQNVTEEVMKGDKTTVVHKGDFDQEISTGNFTQTVKMGNIKVDAKAGTITMTAATKITLKVGGSSVVIDQAGVKVTGTGTANVEAPMVKVAASGILTLSGSLTKIN